MFEVTEAWQEAFPGAHAGVLVMKNVLNPASHAGLERCKEALIEDLRSRYGGLERSQWRWTQPHATLTAQFDLVCGGE